MAEKCVICNSEIKEEFGKLQGTVLKVKENNKNKLIYVCSDCQKTDGWIEKAKIKSA
ncbi:MAG TPA: hypothetical protein VMZ91_11195 [Candidatus Paceibacterota bacterium]|nr:hypothetical protein [Candidatus Paceibacterota bacterium]